MGRLSITTISVTFAAPAAGFLAERYGTRRVTLTSMVMFGFAFMSLALQGGSITQFYLTWGLIALVGAGTLPITFTRTVNCWFDRHRGMALGIAMTGTGLFGVLCKPYLAWIIGLYGWRAGYVALGALPLLIALPICLLKFHEPAEPVDVPGEPAPPLTGLSRAEALRSWRFWLLVVAMLFISFCLAGSVPNLEGILRDRGFDAGTILSLTPLIGLSAIAGRLAGGWLLDRIWAPGVAFVMLGMPAIAFLILAGGTYDVTMATIAIVMIGFALGIEYDVLAFLTSRYFGLRAYAGLYAILYVSFSLGAGFAPLAFGLMRDANNDYVSCPEPVGDCPAVRRSPVPAAGSLSEIRRPGNFRTRPEYPVKAYQIGPQTGLASLTATTRPDPVPGPGEAVLKVRLAALNNRDVQVLEGRYGAKKAEDRIPGSEGVGEVVALGEGVQGIALGDRAVFAHFANWLGGAFAGAYFGVGLRHDATMAGWPNISRFPPRRWSRFRKG